MRLAVIGAGRWGRNHVRTLRDMGALALVAEAHGPTREKLSAEFPDVRCVIDHADALKSDADGIVLATPVATHHALAREALLAGKDVLVEKPMAMTAAEADDLVRIAAQSGRLLMVGHLLLYQPAVERLRALVHAGVIGRLVSLHQERLNLGTARSFENALWSLGVHDVAVQLWLVGERPSDVHATGQSVTTKGIDDDVHVHLRFPSGVHAHLHASWLWPERRRRLTLVGTEGMLVYDEADHTITLHHKGIASDLSNRDAGSEVVFRGSGEPLRLELEHFLECIRSRATPRSDGASGAEVVRVLETAQRRLA